ncbi:MAG: DUF11 domain-containing protein [Gammaproteobacteria bacterium]
MHTYRLPLANPIKSLLMFLSLVIPLGLTSGCGIALCLALFSASAQAQIDGEKVSGSTGIRETTEEIMERQPPGPPPPHPDHELEYPDRSRLPQNPDAQDDSQFPPNPEDGDESPEGKPRAQGQEAGPRVHTTSLSFDGPTLTDTGAFPPDSMGTIGPTQYIAFVNGRLRSFTRAGTADGVLNASPDVFFSSVMTPAGGSVLFTFTSDPQIRYDRFTARWILIMIDVPCTNATCTTTAANRVLVAVSDAASNGTISAGTVWTFFQFQPDGTNFCDYPSLGVDVNALYIGCIMFTSAGSFVGTNGYVVRKSSVLGAGPIAVTGFPNLAAGAGAGPFAPRGVDNVDPAATEGYFVGVDNATFSTLMFRRVSNPGSVTPTISANISVTVPTTTSPNPVTHAGNTGGNNGRLDSLDDRLFAATLRGGRLWTAHNFRVSSAGVANTAAAARNATRWYEFQNLTTTPTLVQSGTVFDNAATLAAARQYFIPSITVTGQGHAVVGFTMAGTPVGATPAYASRLAGDTLGTMSGPPTTAATAYGTTTANYNPAADPGGTAGRRWGDYSFTVVDPLDEMTVWTIQEYNQALNSYAVRIGKLLAPPPATPTCSATPITFTGPTGNVVINATSSSGSGFYDPGANLPAPARPFNHIAATMTNGTVNSVTFNSPTQVTLNITANVPGLQNVTITNPDGQSVTANGCINVSPVLQADVSLTKTLTTAGPFTAGQSISYSLVVANAGPSAATNVQVTDTPTNLSITTVSGGGCAALPCTIPTLASGANATITVTATISAAGAFDNSATATATESDPNAANNTDNSGNGGTANAANVVMSATKTVTGTFRPGGAVTYTVVLSNSGSANQTDNPGNESSDVLPAQLTLVSASATAGTAVATLATNTVTWNGSIAPSSSVTLTINATIKAGTPPQTVASQGTVSYDADGNGTNEATRQTDDPTKPGAADPTSFVVVSPANVSATKTVTGTFHPGGAVTYTVVLANSGPSNQVDNPGNEFSDVLPAQLTLVSASATAGTAIATLATNTVTWNGSIVPSGSVTLTINATIKAGTPPQTVSNQGTVSYDADGNGTNEATHQTDDPTKPGAADPTSFAVTPLVDLIFQNSFE